MGTEFIVVPPHAGTRVLEFLETDVAAATSAGNDAELMRVFSLYIGLEDRTGGYLSRFFARWRGSAGGAAGPPGLVDSHSYSVTTRAAVSEAVTCSACVVQLLRYNSPTPSMMPCLSR